MTLPAAPAGHRRLYRTKSSAYASLQGSFYTYPKAYTVRLSPTCRSGGSPTEIKKRRSQYFPLRTVRKIREHRFSFSILMIVSLQSRPYPRRKRSSRSASDSRSASSAHAASWSFFSPPSPRRKPAALSCSSGYRWRSCRRP